MGFYDSFINTIIKQNYKINIKYYNKYFKSFLIKLFINNYYNNICINDEFYLLSIYLKYYLKKPQQLIEDNDEYYIALDMVTNTKYICFKSFCVIDFDVNKNNFENKDDIINYINQLDILKNICYYIVETFNGYHLYLLDEERQYDDFQSFKFIMKFNSDIYYKFYCYLRGYSIRLNLKNNHDYVIKNIKLINKSKNKINNKLFNLFKMHLKHFDNKSICKMK